MLRPYQEKQLADITQAARTSKRILVQSPTGSGKSLLFADLIRRACDKGKQALFLVHRRELIFQAEGHLSRQGIKCGIIMAGEEYTPGCQVQLGSVATVHRRRHRMDFSRFSLVVLDEAHHASSVMNKAIIDACGGAHVLGFTATPIRKGGAPLGDVFETLVIGPAVAQLQAGGFLCGTEYMVPTIPDLRGVATAGGDYSEKGLQEKAVPKLIGGVVEHYLRYGGAKGIIFTCGIQHSNWLKEEFAHNGVESIVIDSKTPEEERAEGERHFREADRAILINCGIFTEGYDVPECDTMILARPTKSLGLYLQCAGRGLRSKASGGGVLIIDHGANVYRHGLVEDEHEWSLAASEDKSLVKEAQSDRIRKMAHCPECGAMLNLSGSSKTCHSCGHVLTHYDRAKNVRELRNCGLVLLDKKRVERVGGNGVATKPPTPTTSTGLIEDSYLLPQGDATYKQWMHLVRYAAMKDARLGYAVQLFKNRYGTLPWNQPKVAGARMPRGRDEWGMKAKQWMAIAYGAAETGRDGDAG